MPVSGPDDNKENADVAIKLIAELLKEKFSIDINQVEDFGVFKDDINNSHKFLKEAIYAVFKADSWDKW